MSRLCGVIVSSFTVFMMVGCGTHAPIFFEDTHYEQRVKRFNTKDVSVEASALGSAESTEVFGTPLNESGIQPVWIKITNNSDNAYWFFPISVDAEYYPAYEVARRAYQSGEQSEDKLYEELVNRQITHFILPGQTISGFIYTNSDEGMKSFQVELHGLNNVITHTFVAPVPGLPHKYLDLEERSHYQHAELPALNEDELRQWLKTIECCAQNIEGKLGDPINVVLIGRLEQVRDALVSRHWDIAAPITGASIWRTIKAFIAGSRYRYAPISELYLFNREHDIAFQKSRDNLDERNHMRLWLAPVTLEGTHVWLAQISRDVGVKLSGRLWPPTTHVIDPDVDEARFYLFQDLLEGGHIRQIGYAKGHEETTIKEPHYNAENDPYFTDGLILTMFLSEEITAPGKITVLDWELPDAITSYRNKFTSK